MRIQLNEAELKFIKTVLRKNLPSAKFLIFGSRARQTAKNFSDVDIAIDNGEPILLSVFSNLTEEFSNSDLPYKVDLIDYNRVSKEFQNFILKEAKQL